MVQSNAPVQSGLPQNAAATSDNGTPSSPSLDRTSARQASEPHDSVEDQMMSQLAPALTGSTTVDLPTESPPYFGSTTLSHVWSAPNTATDGKPEGTHEQDNQPQIPDVKVNMHSTQLKTSLIRAYFKYEPLWLSVVHKGTFMTHRKNGTPSQWYSDFLEIVVLACAARLSTSSAVRNLALDFAKEAKARMIDAIQHPCAASLQGFLLLSEFEVTYGHDRFGWQLCGIACRMASDLGLHHRMEAPTVENGPSLTEANLFFNLLCACISYEGIWCVYLGRPSSIQQSIQSAVLKECRKPSSQVSRMAFAWIELCIPMAEINDLLNKNTLLSDAATLARLRELDATLRNWYEGLPPNICYNSNNPDPDTTAYGMLTQYCKVRILIHQYLINSVPSSMQQPASLEESQQIMHTHALMIAKLLLTYRQLFGIEKTPSLMLDNSNLAATVLLRRILDLNLSFESNSRDVQWIRSIVSTLEAIEPHFPITRRMIQSLQEMVAITPFPNLLGTSVVTSRKSNRSPHFQDSRNLQSGSTGQEGLLSDQSGSERSLGGGIVQDHQQDGRFTALDHLWLQEDAADLAASVMSFSGMHFIDGLGWRDALMTGV